MTDYFVDIEPIKSSKGPIKSSKGSIKSSKTARSLFFMERISKLDFLMFNLMYSV